MGDLHPVRGYRSLADNPSGPTELSDSDVFPIGAGSYGSFAGAGPALVKYGNCQKMAIVVLNLAATQISGNNIAYSFKQAGGTVVGIQAVSPTLPDYSTVVQTAIQQGADCISQVMGGSMEAESIRAVASSSKPGMVREGGSDFTPSEFNSLKKYMNGSISTSANYFLPVDETAGVPAGGLSAFVDAMIV